MMSSIPNADGNFSCGRDLLHSEIGIKTLLRDLGGQHLDNKFNYLEPAETVLQWGMRQPIKPHDRCLGEYTNKMHIIRYGD